MKHTNVGQVPVGIHYLEVRAYDPYNQFCSATFKITVEDTTDPIWDFNPIDQSIELGDSFNYDLDASDLSGISGWWLNDTSYFTIYDVNGVITNSTSLSEGNYWLEVRAYDPYGQYCSAIIKITVEQPTIPDDFDFTILIFSVGIGSVAGLSVILLVVFRKKRSAKLN